MEFTFIFANYQIKPGGSQIRNPLEEKYEIVLGEKYEIEVVEKYEIVLVEKYKTTKLKQLDNTS